MTPPTSPPPAVTTQPAGGAYALTIVVHGTPAPQGSKRHVGRGVMVESSAALRPWREAVKWAALAAAGAPCDCTLCGGETSHGIVRGPLAVNISFTLPKPTSAPKRTQTWPDRKPDTDKLLRACLDSITDAGVWHDDGQVIDLRGRKLYPGEGFDALPHPGAVIRIARATAELPPRPPIAELIERSSFSTPGAQALRARTSPEVAREIVRRAGELA